MKCKLIYLNGFKYEVHSTGDIYWFNKTWNGKTEHKKKMRFSKVDGYNTAGFGSRKNRKVHRLIAELFIGPPPSPKHTDINHKNGIRDDNRIENLEWCTRSENVKHAYAVLGVKNVRKGCYFGGGVSFNKRCKKWAVYVKREGKQKHYGYFDTEEEAREKRNEIRKSHD